MCLLTVKCDKCKRAIKSMKWKVQRQQKAIEKLSKSFGKDNYMVNNMVGQMEGVEWCIRKLEQQCDCEVINITS